MITSTAALVAIIGGFLVSRVISIASEQSSVKRKLREINNDIRAKEGLIEKVNKYIFEDDLTEFVENKDVIRGLLDGKSLERIVREEEFDFLSVQELKPYFKQLQEILAEILAGKEVTLEDMKRKQKLKYPERESWYIEIFNGLDDLAEDQRSIHPTWMDSPINFNPPRINNERQNKEKELGQLEVEVTILHTQREEQERILKDFGKPKYVMGGLLVLAYASVVGMVYPSTLLPYPPGVYNDVLTKWWVLSLFFSHIVVIFTYLFVAMKRLGSIGEEVHGD
ncbi:hypothetical protein M1I95_21750 [Rossellomorea marisflavi]|uniref:hypothetical protein n=1 Tax=Rossellomorea marisflavi TaxID=189381 RepID=UPI0027A0601C|nr:hypothetical protein [Rossellomorea marisflavi]UTE72817.1 hypothetical protein M1I95_21750 [Rossellomorea marisflavi]